MDTARGRRERPVFPGIGRELVECEPNRLRGSGLQAQLGAVHEDPRANEICEMRELGAGQVLDLYTAPLTPYQQVLIGRKQVVDRGGFTAAGRTLRTPKSTLSHRNQRPETDLRGRLLNPTSPR